VAIAQLANGITIEDIHYRPVRTTLDRRDTSNCWLTMTLNEGKNREIKILLQHIGLSVTRLIRTGYGPFDLGKVAPGYAEEVPVRQLPGLLPGYFDSQGVLPVRRIVVARDQ
jgi:23S rRNA pseudouridine2605 synthase